MAAVLALRFPEKAPELWAYQSTILVAAHNYEGANWVAYDRQFRRATLAKKDLNWSVPDTRLYNEAFTGRARSIPWCPHCLSNDHSGTSWPHNPNPPILRWFQGSAPSQYAPAPQLQAGPWKCVAASMRIGAVSPTFAPTAGAPTVSSTAPTASPRRLPCSPGCRPR